MLARVITYDELALLGLKLPRTAFEALSSPLFFLLLFASIGFGGESCGVAVGRFIERSFALLFAQVFQENEPRDDVAVVRRSVALNAAFFFEPAGDAAQRFID